MIETGLIHTSETVVAENNTAIALGSGDMPVFATPAMMALMENAAMLAVADELPEGCTTVGGHMVRAMAEVTKVEGKKIYFKVSAYAGDELIGEGEHLRFVVDKEKFLSRLK